MTPEALWNLQHGVPEDKRFPWRDYTPTSYQDHYVLHRMDMINKFRKKQHELKQEKDLEKEIEKQVEQIVDKTLDDLLKSLNKK